MSHEVVQIPTYGNSVKSKKDIGRSSQFSNLVLVSIVSGPCPYVGTRMSLRRDIAGSKAPKHPYVIYKRSLIFS